MIVATQKGNVVRFDTASGFTVETYSTIVPSYNQQGSSIDWYDAAPATQAIWFDQEASEGAWLDQSASEGVWSSNCLAEPIDYSSDSLSKQLCMVYYQQFWNSFQNLENEAMQRSLSIDLATIDRLTARIAQIATTYFECGSTVTNQIKRVRRYFNRFEFRIVAHKIYHAILFVGRNYVISSSDRERIELSAREHVTHLSF